MPGRYSTVVRSTAKNERKRGGVLPLPKIVMVKRKTDSYELLPDHRLFMITSIVLRITGADRFSAFIRNICLGPARADWPEMMYSREVIFLPPNNTQTTMDLLEHQVVLGRLQRKHRKAQEEAAALRTQVAELKSTPPLPIFIRLQGRPLTDGGCLSVPSPRASRPEPR